MCCGSYRGRLRTIKLFLRLHGSSEYIKMGLWWLERLKTQWLFFMDSDPDLGSPGCCCGYRG